MRFDVGLQDTQPNMSSTYDLRQQILANALVLFPDLVGRQSGRFHMPPWAPMLFEIAILPAVKDGAHGKHYRARLTHPHPDAPAVRVTLLGGHADPTIGGALQNLLEVTIDAIGERELNLCPPPPGLAQPAAGRRGHDPEKPDLRQRHAASTSVEAESSRIVRESEVVGEVGESAEGVEEMVGEVEEPEEDGEEGQEEHGHVNGFRTGDGFII